MRTRLALLPMLLVAATLSAQAPQFDAASIKPSKLDRPGGTMRIAGGRLVATNVPVRNLLITAYSDERQLLPSQIIGAPDWADTDRFDIEATATEPLTSFRQAAPLLRSLLEDRFKVRAHFDQREQQVFTLTLARPDGRLGPNLQQSTLNCLVARGDGPPSQPRPGQPACGITFGPGSLTAGDMSIANLTRSLSGSVQRVVVDQTGLMGAFDVDLKWKPDDAPADDDRASIFTAVQEQLGLKLQPTKAVIDVLVVDHVERPSEN